MTWFFVFVDFDVSNFGVKGIAYITLFEKCKGFVSQLAGTNHHTLVEVQGELHFMPSIYFLSAL